MDGSSKRDSNAETKRWRNEEGKEKAACGGVIEYACDALGWIDSGGWVEKIDLGEESDDRVLQSSLPPTDMTTQCDAATPNLRDILTLCEQIAYCLCWISRWSETRTERITRNQSIVTHILKLLSSLSSNLTSKGNGIEKVDWSHSIQSYISRAVEAILYLISNISYERDDICTQIVEQGAIFHICRALKCSDTLISSTAASALQNLVCPAGKGAERRAELMMSQDILAPLLSLSSPSSLTNRSTSPSSSSVSPLRHQRGVSALSNLSAVYGSRDALRRAGVIDVFSSVSKCTLATNYAREKATIGLAFLVDDLEDRNSLLVECDTIALLVRRLEDVLIRNEIYFSKGEVLLDAATSLATITVNAEVLIKCGVGKLLVVALLRDEEPTLQKSAALCLVSLSFTEDIRKNLLNIPDMVTTVSSIAAKGKHHVAGDACRTALWLFGSMQRTVISPLSSRTSLPSLPFTTSPSPDSPLHPQPHSPSSSLSLSSSLSPHSPSLFPSPHSLKHIMISYSWKHKAQILTLLKDLRSAMDMQTPYPIWIDVESMGGSCLEAMASAVEGSHVIIFTASTAYHNSVNCRRELEYATKLNIPLIPLKMEKDFHPRGWLGIVMGDKIYFEMKSDGNEGSGVTGLSDFDFGKLQFEISRHVPQIRWINSRTNSLPSFPNSLSNSISPFTSSSLSLSTSSSTHSYSLDPPSPTLNTSLSDLPNEKSLICHTSLSTSPSSIPSPSPSRASFTTSPSSDVISTWSKDDVRMWLVSQDLVDVKKLSQILDLDGRALLEIGHLCFGCSEPFSEGYKYVFENVLVSLGIVSHASRLRFIGGLRSIGKWDMIGRRKMEQDTNTFTSFLKSLEFRFFVIFPILFLFFLQVMNVLLCKE